MVKEKGKKENRGRVVREKGGEIEIEIFLVFRQLKLDGPRIKVGPRNESYAWVQKSRTFVKLQEVRNFPTRVIFNLKAI